MVELFILSSMSILLPMSWTIFNAVLFAVYKLSGGKMNILEYFKEV